MQADQTPDFMVFTGNANPGWPMTLRITFDIYLGHADGRPVF